MSDFSCKCKTVIKSGKEKYEKWHKKLYPCHLNYLYPSSKDFNSKSLYYLYENSLAYTELKPSLDEMLDGHSICLLK